MKDKSLYEKEMKSKIEKMRSSRGEGCRIHVR